MNRLIETYHSLRLLVGYLGEKNQHGWWASSFLSPTAPAFLQPAYPRSAHLAASHGVVEAARLLHDEHIGVGQVFHLFRLPEAVERDLHDVAQATPLPPTLTSPDAAARELARLAVSGLTAPQGPVRIGTQATILTVDAAEDIARHYASAFVRGIRCFPYFTAS